MKFMLGVNYWGRDWGTEMWRHYDGEAIRRELRTLADHGVRCLRVFPNWRDFQPIDRNYGFQGAHGEYVNANTGAPVYDDGVDMDRIADFRDFCHAAEACGLTLVVSIVTGWMSGRLFCPPALNGQNLITSPEARMLMRRFIHRFVGELKNEKSIVMWDLGNECNCMAPVENEFEAYGWTATVADAIRTEDASRPVSSGMHSLETSPKSNWKLVHQGEICDVLCTHPYPSPTVGGNREPYTELRMTFLPTAQSLYYAGVGKKPSYIQESGTFSQTIGSTQMSSDFLRIQILSALANGLLGYQWWCAWDQDHLDFFPYTWSMIERELGMFKSDGEPKPAAYTMKRMAALLESLPDPFPKRRADGVCVLSNDIAHQNIAIASLTLAKQAGLDLDVAYSNGEPLPNADLYFLPSIRGWACLYKPVWYELLERTKQGATLCISVDNGQITTFPDVVGATSMGIGTDVHHSFEWDGERIDYAGDEILLKPTSAEVLAQNEQGNPVLLKNRYGKGTVYFINFAPERIAFETSNGFNKYPYYRLYGAVAKEFIEAKPIVVHDKRLGVTVNPENEREMLVTVLNYFSGAIAPEIRLADGYAIKEVLYGNTEQIPACDGLILRIFKK